jgi:hypothetical protein
MTTTTPAVTGRAHLEGARRTKERSGEAFADADPEVRGIMTETKEVDRLIDQITRTLRRDPRFPHLSCLENELLFRDLQRELEDMFDRIFEAGYDEGKFQAELEAEEGANANHHSG